MPWSTERETTIRRYCRPVAQDTDNWPDLTLQDYFTRAHTRLKGELCPPFSASEFDEFNDGSHISPLANELIGTQAAILIYNALPGKTANEETKLTEILAKWITDLKSGEKNLYKSDGSLLTRTAAVYHNNEGMTPTFTRSRYDSNNQLVGTSGSLDQFDP